MGMWTSEMSPENPFFQKFMPRLNEMIVFQILYAVTLLMVVDGSFSTVVLGFIFDIPASTHVEWPIIVLAVLAKFILLYLFVTALVHSAVHVFIKEKIGQNGVVMLTGMTIIIISLSAVAIGAYILSGTERLTFALVLLPGYNFLCAYTYMLFFMHGLAKHSFDVDYQAGKLQVILGTLVITAVVLVLRFVLEPDWSVTLSLSVSICTRIEGIIKPLSNLIVRPG